MINVTSLAIPDVKLIHPQLHADNRGYVTEIIHDKQMAELGLPISLVQENQSMSAKKYTVRGLHAQQPPHAQAKLVRVLQGRIFDVAVDIRPTSTTYGQHVSAVLSHQDVTQMYVPAGFLHGFCTLEDNTVVLYKMSNLYAPGTEIGAIWNDPALAIDWPIPATQAILSNKDKTLPPFQQLPKLDW